jgi:hypothetical protein
MIELSADTPAELHQQMIDLLAGTSLAGAQQDAAPAAGETTSKPRGRGKKTDPIATGQPAASADAGASGASAGDAASASTGSGQTEGKAATGDVTKETIGAKAMQLAQKSGPTALAELWTEFGAGKLSEIDPTKYAAVDARLTELLGA